ncbi:MAG: hypothetical protein ACOX6N_01425 [Patescibacteria group bacterium]|jgi:hypothetical protein
MLLKSQLVTLACIISFIGMSILLPMSVFAGSINEDFNNYNDLLWNFVPNEGSISVDNGNLILGSNS